MAPTRLFDGLTFKVANDIEQARALEFRRHIYTQELGHAGLDDSDRVAAHLVALDADGAIVAALRVIGPSHRPFDLERLVDLHPILSREAQPAEVSRFCVERSRRAVQRGQVVHLGMLKLLHAFAERHRITDLLTLGLPNLQKLYQVGFFTPLGITVDHTTWGSAELMCLNLAEVRKLHEHSKHPMARLLFHACPPNIRC